MIKQIAYKKYQLDWMLRHGHTLEEIIQALAEYMEDSDEPLVESYWQWEDNCGFEGEIWACFEEFIECEYQDREYIARLLDSDQYAEYLLDIGDSKEHSLILTRRKTMKKAEFLKLLKDVPDDFDLRFVFGREKTKEELENSLYKYPVDFQSFTAEELNDVGYSDKVAIIGLVPES